jgi:mannose-1-phosphate guanylyltransferase/mannose-1-phosphate guanylyltransferase/mannose-6-phosphate isomerase
MKTYKEARPWGEFVRYTNNELSTIKVITVKEGEQLSLQFHNKRSEFWRVLTDGGEIIIDGVSHPGKKDSEFFIPVGVTHQVKGPMQFLEIAIGDFDEADIVRLEDKYNRI